MSPAACEALFAAQHIITTCLVRGRVKRFGSEDIQELAADGTAMAARILSAAAGSGKGVPAAGSVAHYVLKGLQAGRRFSYTGRSDVMSPGAQLSGNVSLVSLDAPVDVGDENGDEGGNLHAVLAATGDDTDATAARALDWEAVYPRLDDRRKALLNGMALGFGTGDLASRLNVSPPRACQLRESLGKCIVNTWGTNGIADATAATQWRQGMRAAAERRACRYERLAR